MRVRLAFENPRQTLGTQALLARDAPELLVVKA